MKIVKLLQSQGFGTRKECELLIKRGSIFVNGSKLKDLKYDVSIKDDTLTCDGEEIEYSEKVVVALNKPSGYECSHKPQKNTSVFELLDSRLVNRKCEPVGRLDADTTGLLIFTDNGTLNHTLSSPKKNIEKRYKVTLKHTINDHFKEVITNGVKLRDSNELFIPSYFEVIDNRTIILGITEGKYHQVKRMVAAASNRVEALERVAIGSLLLNELHLEIGRYTYLSNKEIELLSRNI